MAILMPSEAAYLPFNSFILFIISTGTLTPGTELSIYRAIPADLTGIMPTRIWFFHVGPYFSALGNCRDIDGRQQDTICSLFPKLTRLRCHFTWRCDFYLWSPSASLVLAIPPLSKWRRRQSKIF